MILTCPSCSASYNVPAEAIGPKGREVRCKKCAHVWFQAGEKKALDDIFTRMESHRINEDDISFADRKKEKRSLIPAGLVAACKLRCQTILVQGRMAVQNSKVFPYFVRGQAAVNKRNVAAVMVAFACFSVVLLTLVVGRWSIVHTIPSMEGVYKTMGFSLESYANVNPEEALVVEHPAIQKTDAGRVFTGNLINLTSSEILLPTLQFTLIDKHGQKVAEFEHNFNKATLRKEAVLPLSIPFEKDAAAAFSNAEIRFVGE